MSKEGSIRFRVLRDFEGRYSMWPSNLKIPAGWEDTGKCGSKEEAVNFVKELSGVAAAFEDSVKEKDKGPASTPKSAWTAEYEDRPLVSIIMPTFNREKLLPVAIKSILNQTYTNWELLVVDDRSTDNTKELIEHYSNKDGRIKYLLNERSKGPSGARNFGIHHAEGKYIAFLDSDDEWLEHHLSSSLEVLLNEKVKVCFAGYYERVNGKIVSSEDFKKRKSLEKAVILLKPRIKGKLVFFGEGFFEYNIMERFNLYHINTLVLEKGVLDVSGIFNENLPVNEDYDFMFRIFYHYDFCYIDDYHFIYNFGQDNLYAYTYRRNLLADETAFDNEELVKRLTFTITKRVTTYSYRKELVRTSSKIKNPDYCIEQIDAAIGRAYLTLGYINIRKHKIRAVKYLIKSLQTKYNKYVIVLLGRVLFPIGFKRVFFDICELILLR